MPNPYEDDSVDPDAANGALLDELRSGAEEKPEDDAPESVVIGDPVEPEENELATDEETPRNRKRRERGERYREKQQEDNDENQQLRTEMAELRGQLTAIQSQRVAPQQQQQAPMADQYADRRGVIKKARQQTLKEYELTAGQAIRDQRDLTEEEKQSFFDRNEKHNADLVRVEIESVQAEQNTPAAQAEQRLIAQYPDVMTNPGAREYARSMYFQRVERGEIKRDDDRDGEKMREVMEATRRELKMGAHKVPPKATDKQRSSYGTTGRAGGAGSGPKRFVFNEADKRMALSFYRHMPDWSEQQKLQAYANMQKES